MYVIFIFISIVVFVPKYNGIHKEIKPYIQEIKEISRGNLGTKTSRVGFFKKNNKVLGTCNMTTGDISINKKHWKKLSKWSKIMLLAHEIIHCECKLGHITALKWDSCPESIMHTHDGGEYCNDRYKKQYIEEMQTIRCN